MSKKFMGIKEEHWKYLMILILPVLLVYFLLSQGFISRNADLDYAVSVGAILSLVIAFFVLKRR